METNHETPEQIEIFHLNLDVEDRQESIELIYALCKNLLKKKNADISEYVFALEHILFHITEFIE